MDDWLPWYERTHPARVEHIQKHRFSNIFLVMGKCDVYDIRSLSSFHELFSSLPGTDKALVVDIANPSVNFGLYNGQFNTVYCQGLPKIYWTPIRKARIDVTRIDVPHLSIKGFVFMK